MFDAVVQRGGRAIACFSGLNDAVVRSSEYSRIVGLRLHLSSTYIARYRADGVILATPTGSTAYSMSAGGPILHPEMEAFILNPICPFTLASRPMVVPDSEELAVEVEERQRTGVVLLVDGQEMYRLQPGDRVVFRKSARSTLHHPFGPAQLLRGPGLQAQLGGAAECLRPWWWPTTPSSSGWRCASPRG